MPETMEVSEAEFAPLELRTAVEDLTSSLTEIRDQEVQIDPEKINPGKLKLIRELTVEMGQEITDVSIDIQSYLQNIGTVEGNMVPAILLRQYNRLNKKLANHKARIEEAIKGDSAK